MASQIDATKPADNVQIEKSDMRSNFAQAKSEITVLQRQTTLAWQLAMGVKDL